MNWIVDKHIIPSKMPSCHASTILQNGKEFIISYFAGPMESHPVTSIFINHFNGKKWSKQQEVAGFMVDSIWSSSWNPVLFKPRNGKIKLYHKRGKSPMTWQSYVMESADGHNWSGPRHIEQMGPVKNKCVQLDNGMVIAPSSVEIIPHNKSMSLIRMTDDAIAWKVQIWSSKDNCKTWEEMICENDPTINAIQPSILIHPNGLLQALGRTRSGKMFSMWCSDGERWNKPVLLDVPNCNSGTDAVTLSDGKQLLIYNHSSDRTRRFPLGLALSSDGVKWYKAGILEEIDSSSYPAVIQDNSGLIHITYTWNRVEIRHVVVDPTKLRKGKLVTCDFVYQVFLSIFFCPFDWLGFPFDFLGFLSGSEMMGGYV